MRSIDPLKLEVLLNDTERPEADKQNARKLQPILSNHHFLLVTLLVANSAATESMPIFLDALVPSWAAVMISSTQRAHSLTLALARALRALLCPG
jgi:metal transporter CNNM